MLPITNLPDKLLVFTPLMYDRVSKRTIQAKPYNMPTSYYRKVRRISERSGSYKTYSSDTNLSFEEDYYINQYRQIAYNKAYERLVGKLGDSSSFGATLTAERRETFGMITGLVSKALKATICAKRGDFSGVLHNLGLRPPIKRVTRTFRRKRRRAIRISSEYYKMPDGRLVLKSAASSWLLWSYGIAPLMNDIQNSTEVFLRDIPVYTTIFGSKTVHFNDLRKSEGGGTRHRNTWVGKVRVLITTEVTVSNPDLHLLNQLGLINPVQWLNEAVPFSFVIDWFSNWSSVIGSLSDFAGLTLRNQCISTTYKFTQDFTQYTLPPYVPTTQIAGRLNCENILFERRIGTIPRPSLIFRYERFEWQRALNAVSLLVGFLPSSTKK